MVFAVNTGIITDANPLSGIKDAFIAPAKKHLPTLLPSQLDDLVKTNLWRLHSLYDP